MKRWLFWGLVWAGAALAQPTPLPDLPPSHDVWIEIDGGCDRVLNPGEEVAFRVGVARAAYLYVFDVRSATGFLRLVPRAGGGVVRAAAGEVLRFPTRGSGVRYQVTGPPGEGYLYLLATTVPLALDPALSASGFRQVLSGLDPDSRRVAWCRYVVAGATEPRAAIVTVATDPAGLEVFVDDVFLGVTPLTAPLAPGQRRLRIEGRGALQTQTLRLAPGDRLELRLRLPTAGEAVTAGFDVVSVPEGAWVYLDGRYACAAPCRLEASPGLHILQLERPGYQVWGGFVRVGGEDAEPGTRVFLEKAEATLTVRSNVDAMLFLDGMPLGWVRAGGARTLAVTSGWHEVVALAPGYEAARERVLILSEDREEVELELDDF